MEDLLWRVLDVGAGKKRALLITERLIELRPYHSKLEETTWEECELQGWLNGEILGKAFTGEERARIAEVINQNPDNDRFGTKGGEPTKDRMFVLSIGEAETYFMTNEERVAVFTPYALKRADEIFPRKREDGEAAGRWWLRSPGGDGDYASCVDDGGVGSYGSSVITDRIAVRPAFWLNL